MNKYLYDAKTNSFYPTSLEDAYRSTEMWPATGIEVDEEEFLQFQTPPAGKVRVAGIDGHPAWGDIPPPARSELIARMEVERLRLMNAADFAMADWRTELALGEISDDDKAKLSAWMAYKRQVKAVSADEAITDDFEWPVKPAE
ncbi:tail fiber assembly protein [Citrobacter tructae]|uniref:Phage tail protein n=1 Tax=Citrobacter tructae TaxID=2562449 RepID=A0ABX5T3S3_9ENTR|nr:tail fiber assembly protein [Citrobacter tructae]QBX80168.1 phage tail protein [Citrobacter tructae]